MQEHLESTKERERRMEAKAQYAAQEVAWFVAVAAVAFVDERVIDRLSSSLHCSRHTASTQVLHYATSCLSALVLSGSL